MIVAQNTDCVAQLVAAETWGKSRNFGRVALWHIFPVYIHDFIFKNSERENIFFYRRMCDFVPQCHKTKISPKLRGLFVGNPVPQGVYSATVIDIVTFKTFQKNASPERGGGPAKLVEGFSWNLLLYVIDFTEVPLSHLRCQLPFQGSLID